MKRILPIVLSLIFSFQISQGQVKETASDGNQYIDYENYSRKAKKQNTAAWILIGVSAVSIITAAAIASNNENSDYPEILFIIPAVIPTLISIPLWILSGSNKKKAEAIVRSGNMGFNAMPSFNNRYVSLGISINI